MAIQRTSPAAFAVTSLNSLASSATAGAQSDEVTSGTTNNITNITTSLDIALPAVGTPSSTTRVDVYVWGTNDDTGYPGGSSLTEAITGGSSTEAITGGVGTITVSAICNNALVLLGYVTQTLMTAQTVRLDRSIVAALGYVPRRWGLVFLNNTGVTLPASGHAAKYTEQYYN